MAKWVGPRSEPTGLYLPCPHSNTHHPQPTVALIMRGPKFYHWRCSCGGSGFCPPGYEGRGMTAQQAMSLGYYVPAVAFVPPRKVQMEMRKG